MARDGNPKNVASPAETYVCPLARRRVFRLSQTGRSALIGRIYGHRQINVASTLTGSLYGLRNRPVNSARGSLVLGRIGRLTKEPPINGLQHWATAAWVQVIAVVLLVVVLHVPLGDYMARVYADTEHWRVERVIYRLIGAQPDNRQRWFNYGFSLLAFSAVSVLFLYGLLLVQTRLPEPWGHKGMTPALAFNTAISFVTNTSWQNYPGESTLGHVGLTAGLGVQAFASCAVGMCVAVALIRGLAQYQRRGDRKLLGGPGAVGRAHTGTLVGGRHPGTARARCGQQFVMVHRRFRRSPAVNRRSSAARWPRGSRSS